jgi:hypothetical protein
MESLEIPVPVAMKVGLPVWLAFQSWARPRVKSPLYRFLCYLLPSHKEIKELEDSTDECIPDRAGAEATPSYAGISQPHTEDEHTPRPLPDGQQLRIF